MNLVFCTVLEFKKGLKGLTGLVTPFRRAGSQPELARQSDTSPRNAACGSVGGVGLCGDEGGAG